MAVDAFLKLDGIKGESTDSKHKDEIELDSYSFGATQTASAAGGAGAGKVQFQDFHFSSRTSKASPTLMLHCASGQHIKEGLITLRKAGENPVEFIHIKLQDALISSYQLGGGGGNFPADQFSLNFSRIEFEYRPQKADGTLDAPVTGGWDLKLNRAT